MVSHWGFQRAYPFTDGVLCVDVVQRMDEFIDSFYGQWESFGKVPAQLPAPKDLRRLAKEEDPSIAWLTEFAQLMHPEMVELQRFLCNVCLQLVACMKLTLPSFFLSTERDGHSSARLGPLLCTGVQQQRRHHAGTSIIRA